MAYSTLSDILEEISESTLIELTDDPDNPVLAVNEAAVSSAIARSDGIIDAYLATRYAVPLDTVPAVVKGISIDLSLYTIFTRRESITDRRQDRYDAAMDFLKGIADGKYSVGVSLDTPSQYSVNYTRDQDFSDSVWELY